MCTNPDFQLLYKVEWGYKIHHKPPSPCLLYFPLLWIFTELEHLIWHWSCLICPQNTCTHPVPFLYCTFLKSRVCVSSGYSNRSFHSDWYNWVCQAFSVRGQVVNFWLCRPKLLSQILNSTQSHRQYINEWWWQCSKQQQHNNKHPLFMDTGIWISYGSHKIVFLFWFMTFKLWKM